ncbi:hypothetical protein MUY14_21640 [Amycolatopsis sp. FBCC-B4732]|uniref:tetratricopeptide repeat protein n=1 Tax=unclassified Amycolatopsis TaxID=2618356 RepID=UPI001FF3C074|nr:hypothetical protein [Amycolatopsis sp. FBCC-B4732]UOX93092.1 hypothetical protein MUY14_21640 [Amycolatopsis sp. FBCC-B4732]
MTAAAEATMRARLRRQADRCAERALVVYARELRAYVENRHTPLSMNSYFAVLRSAHERDVGVPDGSLATFTERLVQVVTNLGRDGEFPEDAQFLRLIEQVATVLHDNGQSTVDILLECARYSASASVGSARRVALIDRAVTEARDDDERLRALRVKALFCIDISDYGTAHLILDRCDAMIAGSPRHPFRRQLAAARGTAYFYRDEDRAMECFRQAVTPPSELASADDHLATAVALHFTGRIELSRGHHEKALACLVLAERIKEAVAVEGTQVGFFHLRVGEILVSRGEREQGMSHFEEAGRIFHTVRQRSSAEAQLDAALARLARTDGDLDRAEFLLSRATESARRDNFVRGELLFLSQLVIVQLRTKPWAAARTVIRAARLATSRELGGWGWLIRQMRSRASSRAAPPAEGPPISCPCPLHDAVPTDRLWSRVRPAFQERASEERS